MNEPSKPRDLYIGIMSGTSLDGIDIAIGRFENGIECLWYHATDFPNDFRSLLYDCATANKIDVDTLVRSHFVLADLYARGVHEALQAAGLSASDIRAIGSHGQTIRHLPTAEALTADSSAIGATFQLGSGPALAALTGIDVVCDFRSADVALGGHGAPLVPMFDAVFLRDDHRQRVITNIGGISNVTILPPRSSMDAIMAYDTGPGNMIIDELMRRYFNAPFDDGGQTAASGTANEDLLTKMLLHDYFAQPPPKSTGRELFGGRFLSMFTNEIANERITPTDAVATATELTARSIAFAMTGTKSDVFVSGGGAKNIFLMQRLQALLENATVRSTSEIGILPEAKEALAFGFFAKAYVENLHIHLPYTTGASRQVILGSLSKGSLDSPIS